ncbi:hypothetical protein AVEN_156768-1 [Araneus ventricosus]|uniref:Uncharacterized protein n=1 Tax=Araneus ventricosus TaxID=182803 RepID=A0A4Y2FZ03_ARAVE|nr:hypothetical protein AVEN_156768-1 [Araneus ventricosus]
MAQATVPHTGVKNEENEPLVASEKILLPPSHTKLEFFPENLGSVSDEYGERCHQDISNMGARYQEKWNPKMLADYCWTLKMDIPQAKHSRQAKYTRK